MAKAKKIYLAGPMRGYKEFNFPAFDEASARGRKLGFKIISPADLDRQAGFSEKGKTGKVNKQGHSKTVTLGFMRGAAWRDFLAIVGPNPKTPGVDAIALLPGWEKSRGATGEKALADWIGLEVLDARTFKPFAAEVIHNGAFVVKDSGARQEFTTGAVRDAGDGKGFFHCIPYIALEAWAKLYEAGAKKYKKHNWKKGIPLSRYLDSAYRHLAKLAEGWTDEDHAAAVIWNIGCFLWTKNEIEAGRLPATLNDL